MSEAAFFDLDHTLVLGRSTERRFILRLIREGELNASDLLRYLAHFAREPRLAGGFFRRNKAYLSGKSTLRLRQVAEAAAAEALGCLSPRGLACLEGHRRAGRLRVLVTGTLDIIAQPLGERLGLEAVIATPLATLDGHFTGELAGLYPRGENKRALIARLAEERGIDLARSWAYGDDASDVPMLGAVGHPVAVNPCRALKRVALERGWPIEAF